MSEITKEHVNAFEHANEIMAALQKGVLLTSKVDGAVCVHCVGSHALRARGCP
jgi:hypothetical protein